VISDAAEGQPEHAVCFLRHDEGSAGPHLEIEVTLPDVPGPQRQLLGAHMVGSEVTELIQGFVVAMNLETTEEELFHTIFPHPTISETMKEAVLDAYGRVLNM